LSFHDDDLHVYQICPILFWGYHNIQFHIRAALNKHASDFALCHPIAQ